MTLEKKRPSPPLGVKGRWWTEKRKNAFSGYLFILPFFLLFAVFGLFPILFSFQLAFFKWDGLNEKVFVGWENFQLILNDALFWKSLYNTFLIGIMGTLPQLIVALVLASALNSRMVRYRHLFRVAYFLPFVTSIVAVSVIFSIIFSSNPAGLANVLLSWVGISPIHWDTSEWGVKIAISVMVFWRWVGYNTIIYLAGLQSIPRELYEAAKIDGASVLQQWRHITLPMLKPVVIFTVFLSTIGSLQLFTEPLVFMGRNLREEGMTVVLYLYRDAFNQFAFGTASATAVVLFIIIAAFSVLNVLLANRIGKGGGL
ncbi:carbohydrate ABC transporter permease [Desmospora profundinema]|uniref:carbohydrate ABC transporter permease n=1 Tax=Desmospora profundinema TaxID=1571184 RepID=UPI00286C77CE|nr:sugar ABC transporter permease [Desmospora profundinema]